LRGARFDRDGATRAQGRVRRDAHRAFRMN